jgi:hypothetical protein
MGEIFSHTWYHVQKKRQGALFNVNVEYGQQKFSQFVDVRLVNDGEKFFDETRGKPVRAAGLEQGMQFPHALDTQTTSLTDRVPRVNLKNVQKYRVRVFNENNCELFLGRQLSLNLYENSIYTLLF